MREQFALLAKQRHRGAQNKVPEPLTGHWRQGAVWPNPRPTPTADGSACPASSALHPQLPVAKLVAIAIEIAENCAKRTDA